MLGFIFETAGKAIRGTVDICSTVVGTVVEEVVAIPSAIKKGYKTGFNASDKDEHETTTEVDDTPPFAKKGV